MRVFICILVFSIFLSNEVLSTDANDINHFMYVSRDRELIQDKDFLNNVSFEGAQVMYSWKSLEKSKNVYDFGIIEEDIDLLKKYKKKLFIQLQDTTFLKTNKAVPLYLVNSEYSGGVVPQCHEGGEIYGWVSKRWNEKVRERFHLLIKKLGSEFDGTIAGINLQETSIEVEECNPKPKDFSYISYRDAVIDNMNAINNHFKKSLKMQYANFMPGEWLPWENKEYLVSIYKHAQQNGIAIGAPDLMPNKKGMVNHAYKLMAESSNKLVKGVAVQDGNYHGSTGSNKVPEGELKSMIPYLYSYALEQIKVKYIFWVKQEPYFSKQVSPFVSNIKLRKKK